MPRARSPEPLPLFPDATSRPAPAAEPVAAAPHPAERVALGAALPSHLYLGTSSWAFPGWVGLVYGEEAKLTRLSRHGLAAYASHPLLGAVGIDRSYYAPVPEAEYAAYRDLVASARPSARYLVKVMRDFTQPWGRAPRSKNPAFLDGELALSGSIGPAQAALGHEAIHLAQFSPMGRGAGSPERFAERLDAFLAPLTGLRVAVELRDAALLCPAYCEVLRRHQAIHCINLLPEMPGPLAQLEHLRAHGAPLRTVLVRWLRSGAMAHDEAESLYDPYDRIQAPAPALVAEVADLLRQVAATADDLVVVVDNKAEGCAPLTLERIAAAFLGRPLPG